MNRHWLLRFLFLRIWVRRTRPIYSLANWQAHSVHPNYIGKYEARHHPILNQGTVIKVNANQRYTTNAPGMVLLQEVAKRAQVPLQVFVVNNGKPLHILITGSVLMLC